MILPNHSKATIDDAKLVNYVLNPNHRTGKHKARVLESVGGFTAKNYMSLKSAILDHIANAEAQICAEDSYGTRYNVDIALTGPRRSYTLRTGWIIRSGEDFPRLTTCYVL